MPICRLIGQPSSWSRLPTQAFLASDRLVTRGECEGALVSLPAVGRECRKFLHLRSIISMTLVALAGSDTPTKGGYQRALWSREFFDLKKGALQRV